MFNTNILIEVIEGCVLTVNTGKYTFHTQLSAKRVSTHIS